jgi:hypothetical protein
MHYNLTIWKITFKIYPLYTQNFLKNANYSINSQTVLEILDNDGYFIYIFQINSMILPNFAALKTSCLHTLGYRLGWVQSCAGVCWKTTCEKILTMAGRYVINMFSYRNADKENAEQQNRTLQLRKPGGCAGLKRGTEIPVWVGTRFNAEKFNIAGI